MWTDLAARLHLSFGNVLVVGGGTLAMILTCLFCWLRGHRSDRIAAATFAVSWIIQFAAGCAYLWLTGDQRPPMLLDAISTSATGAVFLWLALRYDNLWFGAAALFQGLQLALDATDQAIREPIGTLLPMILILGINALDFAMMAAMIGSVISGRRRHTALAQRA